MGYRERLERKLEKRREWAEKRRARSDAEYDRAHKATEHIPFGQPILVGHHSEKRHRADIARANAAMGRSVESAKMADLHDQKADGIERALDRSIFSDDEDAPDRLRERIAELEARRNGMKAVNAAWRKCGRPGPEDAEAWERIAAGIPEECRAILAGVESNRAFNAQHYPGRRPQPFQPYELSNLGGRITAARKRLEVVEARVARQAAAEASDTGVSVLRLVGGYCRVTFAEKPPRDTLDALKAAGFHWGQGSWTGDWDKLPACVPVST